VGGVLLRSAHVCGIEELCIPKLSTSKGEIVENKQPLSSPAGERENIMGTMDINPLLIKLSVPMMVSMLVQALYNVVDSIFVSHVSENALTAVSLAFSLQNVMIAVGVGTGVGVNALLSKSLGEKDQERANKTAENGIFLSLCSYAVFLVIGLTCMKPYFYAQTSDMDIARQGIQYLQLCCVLSLGLFTQTMGEKLLAATGRTDEA
jgi:Na+-driven multidrug efflux pump